VVLPGLGGAGTGGLQPFAVVTPQSTPSGRGGAGLEDSIAQLDAQLQQLAEQLAQAEATKQSLQAQYDETSALLAQMIQEHEQSSR
jgi:septal ring factor EnvC (AmiA/AmiB activator)